MPVIVEECTKKILANPDFKPKKGKTKEESAWAICTAMYKRGDLKSSTSEEEIITFAQKMTLAFDADKLVEGKAKVWVEKHKEEYQEIIQVMEDFADGTATEIITVAEAVGKREAMDEIYKLVSALQDSVYSIMGNDQISDKKAKILKQIAEFKKIADEKIEALEDFKATDKYDIITFSKKVKYTLSDNQDGTVNITHLPIFQLGEHRDYDYDQDWANQTIATHNQLKSDYGFKPPVFIGHKEKEGEEKPIVGFFDNLRLVEDILVADIVKLPKQFATEFPYRSVEVSKSSHDITGLALLGATPPHFKFEPISFKEGNSDKIYLIFSDENINPEGGEIMGNVKFELADESKGFFTELFQPVRDLFKGKKKETPDPDPDKEVYSKDDVAELKKKTEEDMVIKFKEEEKKKDIESLEKVLFKTEDKDQKGKVFAPALKARILALFAQVDNHNTIKFSDNGKESETTGYQLVKDIFSQILNSKEAIIELTEKSAFQILAPPDKNEKFSDEDATRVGKEAAAKVNPVEKK